MLDVKHNQTLGFFMHVDGLIRNANIATFDNNQSNYCGLIEKGCLAWKNGVIVHVGMADSDKALSAEHVIDAAGQLITPGLIDCHTHLVYGGDRAQEFEDKIAGKPYQQIAREGGGIMSTVQATRALSSEQLFQQSLTRLQRLIDNGVTTVEIKSGYGLNYEHELTMLRVIQRLAEHTGIDIHPTCLAAHALPKDFSGTHDDYIAWLCETLLPDIAREKLASAVDIFCETIAFSPEHARQLFRSAQKYGLKVKAHAEQLAQNHGTEVVCEFNGLSVDHLEYGDAQQVQSMGRAGTVAVLLPGAFYFLGETQKPPIELLRKNQVCMAVASDLNPGSSPVFSLTTAANMACVLFGLTPEEALKGITINAAKALAGNQQGELRKGILKKGADADINLWPLSHPRNLVYEFPSVPPIKTWVKGQAWVKRQT